PVRQRLAPTLADDLRAEDDVAEHAGRPGGHLAAAVDREREHVGRLVDSEVIALQRPHLLAGDEREAELAVVDSLGPEHAPGQLDRGGLVDLDAAPILDLDRQHAQRLRSVPVSSACCLYASTIRCTSLCRTTSWCPK